MVSSQQRAESSPPDSGDNSLFKRLATRYFKFIVSSAEGSVSAMSCRALVEFLFRADIVFMVNDIYNELKEKNQIVHFPTFLQQMISYMDDNNVFDMRD